MSTPPKPPGTIEFLSLVNDLHSAERSLHLADLLFQPSRSNAHVVLPYQEGIFRVLEQAANVSALMALRRCLDGHRQSTGIKALEKAGRIPPAVFSGPQFEKISALLDQRLSHSDPRATNVQWAEKNVITRGDVRTLIGETRTAINKVLHENGWPDAPHPDCSDLDAGVDRLIEDLHAASLLGQLRDRARSGLPISSEDVLGTHRSSERA